MSISDKAITVGSIREMASIARACGDVLVSENTLLEIARKLELLADRNVSGLALQKEWQQRAEKAEAELAALAAQKPLSKITASDASKKRTLVDDEPEIFAEGYNCAVDDFSVRGQ